MTSAHWRLSSAHLCPLVMCNRRVCEICMYNKTSLPLIYPHQRPKYGKMHCPARPNPGSMFGELTSTGGQELDDVMTRDQVLIYWEVATND